MKTRPTTEGVKHTPWKRLKCFNMRAQRTVEKHITKRQYTLEEHTKLLLCTEGSFRGAGNHTASLLKRG